MKKTYLLSLFLIMQIIVLSAQENVTVNKKEFKTDKPGFDAAWNHIKDGDSFYSRGGVGYAKALDEYKLAYPYNKLNPELNYKMGVSALFSDRKDESADFLKNAYGLKNDVSRDVLLLTGRALLYKAKFAEAEEKIKLWLGSPVKKSDEEVRFAKRLIEECKNGEVLTRDTIRLEIINPGGNVNSAADDYSSVLSSDGKKMYFASRRQLKAKESSHYKDTKFNENIFVSNESDGKWSLAMPAGENLMTDFCETPLMLDKSGSLLYIYAGYQGGGDIMFSEFRKGEWKAPENEKFGISTDAAETSVSISPDGKEIVFISDRGKKGTGGKDIYFIHNKGHKWSKPMLAGDSLNSEYDEESVCYSRGGDTLWFSSMGHNTLGGYDIFYSVRNPKGGWMKPVNAGYPLNTAWDDMFYVPSPLNDSIFFFSSNRGGGLGGLDIYTGRRLPAAKHAYLQPPQHDTVTVKDTAALSLKKPPVLAKTDSVPSVRPDSAAIKDTTTIKKQPVAIIQSAESRIDNTYTEQISEGELLSERSFARDPDDTEMQIRRRSS